MPELATEQQGAELFGFVMKRLPEVIINSGGVTDVTELCGDFFHPESIVEFFRFVGKSLEITYEQFFESCDVLLAVAERQNSFIIGFVRGADGVLHVISHAGGVYRRQPLNVADVGWVAKTLADMFNPPVFLVISHHFIF